MLRFEWSAFVTPVVLARVASETGVAEAQVTESKSLLANILGRVGGLPFVADEPTLEERTVRGLRLLAEAAAHTLAETGAIPNGFGYDWSEGMEPFYGRRVVARPKVNMNSANSTELATLPGLTPALVNEVLDERGRLGRFSSLDDLERRVNGIGPVTAKGIAGAVVFDDGHDPRYLKLGERGDLGWNLRTLIAMQPEADRPAAMKRALDMILTSCSTNPHPTTHGHIIREDPPKEVATVHEAAWVGELWSNEYWQKLPLLMESAVTTIDVCMFHIAAPNPEHPTFLLIDALRKAHQRGVAVRVLLDRDGEKDPYRSTVINSDAKRFFLDAGVPCRSDFSNRLLHSKYLILDANLVVLGSHNWSSGSYFGFDDLTLAIASPEFAAELGERFETQWSKGN